MAAAYDTYDYPQYWESRLYEHDSEYYAIAEMLKRIKNIHTIIDVGGGFGRLVKSYVYRAKKVILTDPSARLLKNARVNLSDEPKVKFVHSRLENLPDKVHATKIDLAVMVRVLHHIPEPMDAFTVIHKLLRPRGYLLLEFANKTHLKANICEITKGNITFPIEIFQKDIRSKKNIRKNTLPFINFHPDDVFEKLDKAGFEIVETRSVSNIRSTTIKRLFPHEFLLSIEKKLQLPLARLRFGPSLFVLCRKRDES